MKNPLISIIVPVYNVEKYLHKCLDSILSQTFMDWECILVDDGSIDNSGAICDEYTKKEERFFVFHQPNSGVSAARNMGIKHSRGEYITFLDADDLMNNNYLYNILQYSSYPLVVEGYEKFGSQEGFYGPNKNELITIENLPKIWNESPDSYWWFVWGKLFKRNLLIENNIQFRSGVVYLEDFCFVLEYLSVINIVCLCDFHDILHMIEDAKYTKYRMDYLQFRKHMQIHEMCFSVLELKCNDKMTKMRQRIAYRHFCNFENYLLKSDVSLANKIKNAHLFKIDNNKPHLFEDIVVGDNRLKFYRRILTSYILKSRYKN